MAHELTVKKGVAEMAYIGATPWHGLGQVITNPKDVKHVAEKAGMQWSISRAQVQFNPGNALHGFSGKEVLYRSDNKEPLAVVSKDYKIVQPVQVLEFFKELIEKSGYTMETAGTMFGGRRFWALAKTGQAVTLPGKDVVGGYLMLATACDGSMATIAKFTTVRVVCNNTLQMALGANQKSAVKVRHNTNFLETEVKIDLGLEQDTWNTFVEHAKALSTKGMDQAATARAMATAWGDTEKFDTTYKAANDLISAIKASLPQPEIAKRILELSTSKDLIGGQMKSAKGTAWGVMNAATQYFDYEAKRTVDSRLQSSWMGWGADRKVELAQALLAA